MIQAIEYHPDSIEVMEPVVETNIDRVDVDEVEFTEEIDFVEFKGKFLPEKHMHELAVNLISGRKTEGKTQVRDMANLEQEFPNIEQVESVEQTLFEKVKSFNLEIKSKFEFKEVENIDVGTVKIMLIETIESNNLVVSEETEIKNEIMRHQKLKKVGRGLS